MGLTDKGDGQCVLKRRSGVDKTLQTASGELRHDSQFLTLHCVVHLLWSSSRSLTVRQHLIRGYDKHCSLPTSRAKPHRQTVNRKSPLFFRGGVWASISRSSQDFPTLSKWRRPRQSICIRHINIEIAPCSSL